MGSFLFIVMTAVGGQVGSAPSAMFSNVTEQSGVADVVAAHYAKVPTWWLSGMDRIDLDADGDLIFTQQWPRNKCQESFVRSTRRAGSRQMTPDTFFSNDPQLVMNALRRTPGTTGPAISRTLIPHQTFKRPSALDHFNRGCAMADMDRDGIVDYLADAGGHTAHELLLLFGNRDSTFERKQLLAGSQEEGGPIYVDIDADGDLDVLVSRRGYHPPGRRVLLNDGRLNFTDATERSGLTVDGGSIHGVGDLDRDGDLDLICIDGTKAPFSLALYLNDGDGRFNRDPDAIAGAENLRPKSANWGGAVVTDFDNDSLPDIIVNGKYFLAVLRGVGNGRFAVANEDQGLPTGAWSAVDEGLCFGDTDADGDLDIVACGRQDTNAQKGVEHYRNDLPAQNWLRLRLIGEEGNRSAAGAKIRIYRAGGLDDPQRLLWFDQIAIWGRQSFHSYYSHCVMERHFGPGRQATVDLAVEFYPSQKVVQKKDVRANMTLSISEKGTR